MSKKAMIKIAADIGMTIVLMFLMAFELVGREAHERLGMGLFLLFIVHHILNRSWLKHVFRGKYTPFRILQTVLVFFALSSMLASMVSGIIMSRYVFAFLNLRGGLGWARTVHMLAAYWGFVFLSLHQGLHWAVMIGIAKKQVKAKSSVCSVIVKILGILIAGYGGYAFGQRQIASYMFLQSMFVYFDFEEPFVFFILDYMAIMGLFVGGGYYVSKGLKGLGKKK